MLKGNSHQGEEMFMIILCKDISNFEFFAWRQKIEQFEIDTTQHTERQKIRSNGWQPCTIKGEGDSKGEAFAGA